MTWLDTARIAIKILKATAKFTPSKIDDELVASFEVLLENPQIQAIVEYVINLLRANQTLTIQGAYAMVPESLTAEVHGKIGDGKILALLLKILPILLAL